MLVRDGEGATRIAEVRVEGARTTADADRIARTIAESPLVKTALHGGDPNWGRILAAVGRAGVALDIERVDDLDRRRVGGRGRPARATTRRSGARARDAARTRCASASRLRRGQRLRLDVDLRPHPRLRGHQRALPELDEALGRQLRGGSGRGVLGVQPVVPLRPAAAAPRRSRPRGPTRAPSGGARAIPPRPTRTLDEGLAQVLGTARGRPGVPRARRRGRAQLRGDAPRRDRGRPRGPGSPRPQPQRAGGHRAAPLDPRAPSTGCARASRAWSARSSTQGRGRRRRGDARLHAHPRRRADHLRPPCGRPRLGARARPRAPRRRAASRERAAPRLGSARGHRAPPRPRGPGRATSASPPSRRTPSTP